MNEHLFAGFIGHWLLIPESCQYEQGEAPLEGQLSVLAVDDELHLSFDRTMPGNIQETATFAGKPDGKPFAFEGGALADALSLQAVAPNDLRATAYWQGERLMLMQLQLDASGQAIRMTQVVRLPDSSAPANISIYRKIPDA